MIRVVLNLLFVYALTLPVGGISLSDYQSLKQSADRSKNAGLEALSANHAKEAIVKLNGAVKIYQQIQDLQGEGESLNLLSAAYLRIGDYENATRHALESLEKNRSASNEKEEAKSLYHLGNSYYKLGNYEESSGSLKQATDLFRKSQEWSWVVKSLNTLAVVEIEVGNYHDALELFNEALRVNARAPDEGMKAKLLSNMGKVYALRGNYSLALEKMHLSLEKQKLLDNSESICIALTNIGTLLSDCNQREEALHYYREALKYAPKLVNKNVLAIIQYNLGAIHNAMGNHAQALLDYQRSLQIETRAGSQQGIIRCFHKIGYSHMKLNNFRVAFQYLYRSLSMSKKIKQKYYRTLNLLALAETYRNTGRLDTSLKYYIKALKLARHLNHPDLIWTAEHGIGRSLETMGKLPEAVRYYRRAVSTIETAEQNFNDMGLSIGYLENRMDAFESLIGLLYRLDSSLEAFKYIEHVKARNLIQLLSHSRAIAGVDIPVHLSLRKRSLEKRIESLNSELATIYSQNPLWLLRLTSIKAKLIRENKAYQKLLKQIQTVNRNQTEIAGNNVPMTVEQIQRGLPDKQTSLIEYFLTKEAIYAFAIRKTSYRFAKLDTSVSELRDLVSKFRASLLDTGRNRLQNVLEISTDVNLLYRLYDKIFLPLEDFIAGSTKLIIIPDGALYYLPFEALVITPDQTDRTALPAMEYSKPSYLIKRYTISYAPSARVLYYLTNRPVGSKSFKGELLALANPDVHQRSPLLTSLTKAEATTKALAQILPKSLIYTGAEAQKKKFIENAKHYKIIHFATHAAVDENQPLYSKLFFARTDQRAEDALQTYEIYNQPITPDLLFLCACETGLGKLSRGEGLVGLSHAFLYAGAPALIVTLWQVEDSSNEIVLHFYRYLKAGLKISEALRQAKLRLINSDGGDGQFRFSYANPYLWAPFILVGDDKPIFPAQPKQNPIKFTYAMSLLLIPLPLLIWKLVNRRNRIKSSSLRNEV